LILAVFGDVHGNLLALETFLTQVKGRVDAYLCLGDIVNYGPWNDECLECITSLPEITILEGNHEKLFLNPHAANSESQLVQEFTATSGAMFARDDLITDLPCTSALGRFTATHTIDGLRIFADTDISVDRNYVIGHSHYQYNIMRNGRSIVNPGSIGQNRDRIERVEYALFDTDTAGFTFESIPYDFPAFLAELRSRGYPEQCVGYYEGKRLRQRSS
jgi:predicted phosphodiesterase